MSSSAVKSNRSSRSGGGSLDLGRDRGGSIRSGARTEESEECSALDYLARRGSEAENSGGGGEEEEEEREAAMANAERKLADDAKWKRIQQNTFTRWANEHLRQAKRSIEDLETDLRDGLRLIALIEVLSGKKMPRHTKKPLFRSQCLENVSIVLEFLEGEGITLVNIDSTDIVDCKLKLIMGLIWTLIIHYSISMPVWGGPPLGGGSGSPNKTPKQRLMDWIKDKCPNIENFTDDWRDGKAVGALVDSVAPGLCPNWENWDPRKPIDNAREAMDLADKWLDVPKLLTPEEIVDPKVDEQSMMTYLSQFPKAKLKSGAPLRQKVNPNKVRAYGPGLEPSGLVAKAPAKFTVETFGAGIDEVAASVVGPDGAEIPCSISFNNDRKRTYSCSYFPEEEGEYVVTITFASKEIPKSPYHVNVEGFAGDASKVKAYGPGLEPEGVVINKVTYFDIYTVGAGKGKPEVIILDPRGANDTVPVELAPIPGESEIYRCDYVSSMLGLHSVNVFFAGNPIPGSAFGVNVSPASLPEKVWASGRGLQPNGIRIQEKVDFKVYSEGAGEGHVNVKIIGPGGTAVDATSKKVEDHITEYVYTPVREGRHVIMINFANHEIPKSPFEVNVGPHKTSKIIAYGPGLKGGVSKQPAKFTVETNEETGSLGFSIEGPSQAKISVDDNEDGSANITYLPTAPGEYAVHILCDNEDIPGSPYMAQILPATDYFPDLVKCYGPGLENGVKPNEETHFTIDIGDAGNAPLEVIIHDDLGEYKPHIKRASDKIFDCFYTPRKGQHLQTIMVNFGGVAVNGSPFRVLTDHPVDPSLVKVYGPGVESNSVRAGVPVDFTVDASEGGPGDLDIQITSSKKRPVPAEIKPVGNGITLVKYEASEAGPHVVDVKFDNEHVPKSPISVEVKPGIDVSKIKLKDFESRAFVDCPNDFALDASALPPSKKSVVTCQIRGPTKNKPVEAFVNKATSDGLYEIVFTPTEEGDHEIDLKYDGVPLPNSPFHVSAVRGCDPSKVKAYGDGLERGIVDRNNVFDVKMNNAGSGGLKLAVEGPSEAKVSCVDNHDGTCTVTYVPYEEGDYKVIVQFGEENIPGSPFTVPVSTIDGKRKPNASKVTAYGPGLEPGKLFPGKYTKFVVDSTETGDAAVVVDLESPGNKIKHRAPTVIDKGEGIHEVTYIPPPVGDPFTINVLYGGKHIPQSPFELTCSPDIKDVVGSVENDQRRGSMHGRGLQRRPDGSIVGDEDSIKSLLAGKTSSSPGDGGKESPLKTSLYSPLLKSLNREESRESMAPDNDEDSPSRRGSNFSPLKSQKGYDKESPRKESLGGSSGDGVLRRGSRFSELDNSKNGGEEGKEDSSRWIKLGSNKDNNDTRRRGSQLSDDNPNNESDGLRRGSKIGLRSDKYGSRKGSDTGEEDLTKFPNRKFSDENGSPRKASGYGGSPDGIKPRRGSELSSGRLVDGKKMGDANYADDFTKAGDLESGSRRGSKWLPSHNGEPKDSSDAYKKDNRDKDFDRDGTHPYRGSLVGDNSSPDGSKNSSGGRNSFDGSSSRKGSVENDSKRGQYGDRQPNDSTRGSSRKGSRTGSDGSNNQLNSEDERNLIASTDSDRSPINKWDKIKDGYPKDSSNVEDGSTETFGKDGRTGNKSPNDDKKRWTKLGEKSPDDARRGGRFDAGRSGDILPEDEGGYRRGSKISDKNSPGSGLPKNGGSRDNEHFSPYKGNRPRGSQSPDFEDSSRKGSRVGQPEENVDSLRRSSGFGSSRSPGDENSPRRGSGQSPENEDSSRRGSKFGSSRSPDEDSSRRGSRFGSGKSLDDDSSRRGSAYGESKSPDDSLRRGSRFKSGQSPDIEDASRRGSDQSPDKDSSRMIDRLGGGRSPDENASRRGSRFGSGRSPDGTSSEDRKLSGEKSPDNSLRRGSKEYEEDKYSRRGSRQGEDKPSTGTRKGKLSDGIPRGGSEEQDSHEGGLYDKLGDGQYPSAKYGSLKDDFGYPRRSSALRGSPSNERDSPREEYDNKGRKHSDTFNDDSRRGSLFRNPSRDPIMDSLSRDRIGTTHEEPGDVMFFRKASQGDVLREGNFGDGKSSNDSESPSRRGTGIYPSFGDENDEKGFHSPKDIIPLKRGSIMTSNDNSNVHHVPIDTNGYNGRRKGESLDNVNYSNLEGSLPEYHSDGNNNKKRGSRPYNGYDSDFYPLELSNIPVPPHDSDVSAEIRSPSGVTFHPLIENNDRGNVGILFKPEEEGLHILNVKNKGEHVQGSPYKFFSCSTQDGKVRAYGEGLTHGVCGEPAKFSICTKGGTAPGGLALAVEGPSKVEINCLDNKDGTVDVSYIPTAPGEYNVMAKFDDKHLEGSPFTCKVTGEGKKRNQISVGSSSELPLPKDICDYDLRTLMACIVSPSGVEEPCFLKKLPKGKNGISFTPREVGEHRVFVKHKNAHIANSPYKVQVELKDVGDASRVKVEGLALVEGRTHEENVFKVDTRNAGFGGLSLSVEGPSKAEINCQDNENGTLDVSYKPTEPGFYTVNMKFADRHIPGSPYNVAVVGDGSRKKEKNIKRMREAVPATEVGSQCTMTFKMPGIDVRGLESTVVAPSYEENRAAVTELEDGLYAVNFVPLELGIHTVNVKYRSVDIPGSPFQFTVGPLKDGGSHLVTAGGPGLERGIQGQPADFNVWTREAGHGSLAISVEGPSKAEVDFKDRKDGSCHVSYVVEDAGEYSVGIRFNDKHIPDSPFKVCILPSGDKAERVRLANVADYPVMPDNPQTMLLKMNGADGDVECKLVAPSGREDDCFITPLGDGEHSVRFVPKEEGLHYLHARLNGIHIPGSPYKVIVGNSSNSASTVSVSGIECGITGKKSSFIINTSGVGAGTLSVTVDGPSKVDLTCTEVDTGYEVSYTPLVPGKYFVTVRYNDKNVLDSPFRVDVDGETLEKEDPKRKNSRSSMTMETMQRTSYVRHQYSEQRQSISQHSNFMRSSSMNSTSAMPHNKKRLEFGKSNSSGVVCDGSGLERASVRSRNSFSVDCSKAGNNMLFVGVLGPETPCEEVIIKHRGNKKYSVDYTVKDNAEYIIFVKYGDEHVPGSPFCVEAN